MAIKIKHKDPKSTDFSPNDIIINVKEGSVFYKTINNELFKIQGDNLDTVDPNEQLLGQATKYNHIHITHFSYLLTGGDDDVFKWIPLNKTTTDSMHKPLKYTENLYKSIKPINKGIEMEAYGVLHHNGNWKTPSKDIGYGANKNVRPRPFIVGTEALPRDKKEMERLEADTVKLFNKAMKK